MHFFSRARIKSGLITACASLFLVLACTAMHASPITYDLVLTADKGSPFSGTGTLTIDSAPSTTTVSNYTSGSGLENLTFTIDGQNFSMKDPGVSGTLVQFVNGALSDITFSEEIGASPYRFALHSTANYAFYYDNELKVSTGTITAIAPAPEPGSLALLGTGLLGGAGVLFRRLSARRAS
jgi:hypothetical protein